MDTQRSLADYEINVFTTPIISRRPLGNGHFMENLENPLGREFTLKSPGH